MDSIDFRSLPFDRWLRSGFFLLISLLAFLATAWPGSEEEHYLGMLLIWGGFVKMYDAFSRLDAAGKRDAWLGGMMNLFMGLLLTNAAIIRPGALYLFINILFAIEALRYLPRILRGHRDFQWWVNVASFVGNAALVILLYFMQHRGQVLMLSLAVGVRLAGIAIHMLFATTGLMENVDVHVATKLGRQDDPQVRAITERIKKEEEAGAQHDKRWIVVFVVLLFIIHIGRMGMDRTILGIVSPLVATFGDMVVALLVTLFFLGPLRVFMLIVMRQGSKPLWNWVTEVEEKDRKWYTPRGVVAAWLEARIRSEIAFTKAGYSLPTALRSGLKLGLPWAAVLVAIMPVLGMSWYFDTENWASGIWDKWAANRADVWRMAMIKSSGGDLSSGAFRVNPGSITDTTAFSFVVIGDPGEGDASQLVLKDKLIEVSNHEDVKFVVISSDVVYPTGALRDYEKKFWMPFKGVKKPIYAIPGNHDWYDALDGFAATFLYPEPARRAMRARAEADLNLTSSTASVIDDALELTDQWKRNYGVPTGFQHAPFFQMSTGNFVLITLETGIERQIDSLQRRWLISVLEASKKKFVMVLLGHPFFAVGEYQGNMNPKFAALHTLLKEYKVPLVMAGDTHDLEYYKELYNFGDQGNPDVMTHFVNGGGGAYLSIGAAMADTTKIPTKDYAFYPSRGPLEAKIEANTKWYKHPAWWWATALNGWPFSAEWLSAMFDYNVSPYFQSFLKITVSPVDKTITLVPYGNNGRLLWNDLTSTKGARPVGAAGTDWVEWIIHW